MASRLAIYRRRGASPVVAQASNASSAVPRATTPTPTMTAGSGRTSPAPSDATSAFGHSSCGASSPDPFARNRDAYIAACGGGGDSEAGSALAATPPRRAAPPPAASSLGGAIRTVSSDEELPFLLGASFPPSGTLRALETNLFSAPAFEHALHPPGYKLFLLVYDPARRPTVQPSASGSSKTSSRRTLALRRLNGVLLIGQQQPCEQPSGPQVVPRPGTRDFRDLVERRVGFFLQAKVRTVNTACWGVSISAIVPGQLTGLFGTHQTRGATDQTAPQPFT